MPDRACWLMIVPPYTGVAVGRMPARVRGVPAGDVVTSTGGFSPSVQPSMYEKLNHSEVSLPVQQGASGAVAGARAAGGAASVGASKAAGGPCGPCGAPGDCPNAVPARTMAARMVVVTVLVMNCP